MPGLLESLRAVGVPALAVEVVRPTLDDVFLTLTGRSLRDGVVTADVTDNDLEVVA